MHATRDVRAADYGSWYRDSDASVRRRLPLVLHRQGAFSL